MTARALPRIADWYRPSTVRGRFGLQFTINSTMITVVMLLHAHPWAALLPMLALFAATLALQERRYLTAIIANGVIGWAVECWLVAVGGVWSFAVAPVSGMDGGLFGVPFFMLPAWAMVGAAMLSMAAYFSSKA